MNIQIFFFSIFSILILTFSLQVILTNNPVNSAIFLILTFFSTSGIWIFLKSEFLATILIILYVGSIMILFLFIIMMMNLNKNKKILYNKSYLPIFFLLLILLNIIYIIYNSNISKIKIYNIINNNYINIKKIGIFLYTKYIYAFEISSLILLLTIIAITSIIINNNKKKINYLK